MALENAQLTDTQLDVLTVPTGKTYAITSIMVCNTYSPNDATPENHLSSFDMHFLKDNQNLSNAVTCVVRELELPAGETFTFDSEKVILDDGCIISFVAQPENVAYGSGLTDLAVSISYLEV